MFLSSPGTRRSWPIGSRGGLPVKAGGYVHAGPALSPIYSFVSDTCSWINNPIVISVNICHSRQKVVADWRVCNCCSLVFSTTIDWRHNSQVVDAKVEVFGCHSDESTISGAASGDLISAARNYNLCCSCQSCWCVSKRVDVAVINESSKLWNNRSIVVEPIVACLFQNKILLISGGEGRISITRDRYTWLSIGISFGFKVFHSWLTIFLEKNSIFSSTKESVVFPIRDYSACTCLYGALEFKEVWDWVPLVEVKGTNWAWVDDIEHSNIKHENWSNNCLVGNLEDVSLCLLNLFNICLSWWCLGGNCIEIVGDSKEFERYAIWNLSQKIISFCPPIILVGT